MPQPQRRKLYALLIGALLVPGLSAGQGIPMATATLSCGAEGDPDRLELIVTGVFSRADSIVFNGACDFFEVFGPGTNQELVDVVAISGPRAQVIAEAVGTLDIGPASNCPPGGRTSGSGFTEGRGIISFSAALSETQAPPFRPSVVPGRAILNGSVVATVEPPAAPGPADPGEEPNAAYADVFFFFGASNLVATRSVESTNGTVEDGILNEEFSLDLLTNGDLMEFTKAANVEVQLSALPLCSNSERARARAFAAIDPIIEFDQAAFDAQQGANTYPLDSYFQINISPNLNELIHQDGFESSLAPVF